MLKNKLIIFSIVGMLLFYFFVAVYSNIEDVKKSLSSMRLEFLPLILIFILAAVLVKSVRQYYLLKFNNIEISFRESVIIFMAGLSLIFTPGGLGEMIKTKFLKDGHKVMIKNTVPIVVMEKYHEFLASISVISVSMLFHDSIEAKITIIFGIIILILAYVNLRYKKIPKLFKRLFLKIKTFHKIINSEEDSKKTFYVLTSPRKILSIWIISIISMMFELIPIYIIFVSFNLNQFDFILVSQIHLTSLILGYISFLPNGIGITDGSFIGMLVTRNLDLALATSVVLSIRFIGVWFKVSLGFIALRFLKIEKN